ncbi:MAG: biotin--[acetyl-CoA-carboxylase] ligase [Chloroflexota bacterium]|nr:biotin--[acetyl-CoA-carboxylase] ligase [Chloroflexota bacterium]
MTSSTDWNAAAEPGRRVGHSVEFHSSIGSTNDRAWELLRAGADGIAVVAELQTAGRGRNGRSWSSPAGVNLMASVGLRLSFAPENAWQLAAAAGLALLAACRSVLPGAAGARLALKWPNDLVDADGRKVAGLLLETTVLGDRVREAAIGTGVNVNWRADEMPVDLAARSTSLLQIGGAEVERTSLLRAYLAALDAEIAGVESGRSPLERFRAASWLTERRVQVAVGERIVAGQVVGIGPDGSLELETDAGRRSLGYGEVIRVDAGVVDEVPA